MSLSTTKTNVKKVENKRLPGDVGRIYSPLRFGIYPLTALNWFLFLTREK